MILYPYFLYISNSLAYTNAPVVLKDIDQLEEYVEKLKESPFCNSLKKVVFPEFIEASCYAFDQEHNNTLRKYLFGNQNMIQFMDHLFDKIHEKCFPKQLLFLILTLNVEVFDSIGFYSCESIFFTSIFRSLCLTCVNSEYILENKESCDLEMIFSDHNSIFRFSDILKDHDVIDFSESETTFLYSLLLKCLGQYSFKVSYLEKYYNHVNTRLLFQNELELDKIRSFRLKSYFMIDIVLLNKESNVYYYRISKNGYSFNRSNNQNIRNLFIRGLYKENVFNSTCQYHLSSLTSDIDTSSLDDVEIPCSYVSEVDYFLGLLQYLAESQGKDFIVRIKYKESCNKSIEIVSIKDEHIKDILGWFKASKNITEEMLKKIKEEDPKIKNSYFVSLVEQKEFRFFMSEETQSIPVKGECLKLSCSHYIGKELLEEWFKALLSKCPYCNIEVEIDSYFEVDLYKVK